MKWQTNIFIIAVLLATNCATINGIVLDCLYEMVTFSAVGSQYTCTATVLFDGSENENENVTIVYGSHQTGKGHGDVRAIRLWSQNLQFVPTNIENFFPNIIVLNFYSNRITTIGNRHLTPFPNLEHLWLEQNLLTSIDGDLFSGMNALKIVSFHNNTITNVGHDLNLPINGETQFTGNTCFSATAATPGEVATLKLNLLRNCPPTISQIEDSLEKRQNLLTFIDGQVQTLRYGHADLLNRVAYLESLIGGQLEANAPNKLLLDAFDKK